MSKFRRFTDFLETYHAPFSFSKEALSLPETNDLQTLNQLIGAARSALDNYLFSDLPVTVGEALHQRPDLEEEWKEFLLWIVGDDDYEEGYVWEEAVEYATNLTEDPKRSKP